MVGRQTLGKDGELDAVSGQSVAGLYIYFYRIRRLPSPSIHSRALPSLLVHTLSSVDWVITCTLDLEAI